MEKTPENYAFAKILGDEFQSDEDRAEFERDVARIVAAGRLKKLRQKHVKACPVESSHLGNK